MEDEVLIRVEGLSKKFCRDLHTSLRYGVADLTREVLGKPRTKDLRPKEFWAVKDVSFTLKRGESLGLIGRNGAGKTTLLRMLNGLIKPDLGRIEMRGRIGALIALGAGFNPILTGRENIYVNGSVLGLNKSEIDARMDEIIDFAGIGEFVDSPVRNYSSGMSVRLGFAVATSLSPDVLILDEVLAVGDAAFRSKCYRRILKLRENAAIIFVSHNMEQVARVCDKVLVIGKGRMQHLGDVGEGIKQYDELNEDGSSDDESFLSIHEPVRAFSMDLGTKEVVSGATFIATFDIQADAPIPKVLLRLVFYNSSGSWCADATAVASEVGVVLGQGVTRWRVAIAPLTLKSGLYKIGVNILDASGDIIVWSYKEQSVKVRGSFPGSVADCHLTFNEWTMVSN